MARNHFAGKMVYIFGGSSGIGLEIARQAAARGAHVIIFSRNRQRLEQAVEQIAASKISEEQKFSWFQVDVSDHAAVLAVAEKAVETFGAPRILINNAGRAYPRYFEQITYEQFDETMRINLYGIWSAVSALLPHMKAQGAGQIVNTSSLAGFIGVFGYTDYAASKFAIFGFSEALRCEAKPHNISVSVVCPPDTKTPGFEVENQTKPPETQALSESGGLMEPDQVARAILRGIEKRKPVIIPGLDGKFTYFMKRHAPWLVNWIMDRIVRKTRQKAQK